MYLIISKNSKSKAKLLKIIKNAPCPIFVYFRGKDNFEELFNNSNVLLRPKAIVIDEQKDIEFTKKLCSEVKVKYPELPVGVILNKDQTELALFRYVPASDAEIFSPFSDSDLVCFLKKLYNMSISSVSPHLICSVKASYLLGYDMKLSPSENRILVFLSVFSNLKITADAICDGCLNSTSGIETARVLINRINKKAKNISGRPIILNSYENGYYINPEP